MSIAAKIQAYPAPMAVKVAALKALASASIQIAERDTDVIYMIDSMDVTTLRSWEAMESEDGFGIDLYLRIAENSDAEFGEPILVPEDHRIARQAQQIITQQAS